MAWSWSHTAEAYANAEANLRELPTEELRVIFSEWGALNPESETADYEGFDAEAYGPTYEATTTLADDVLADAIWDRASELQTCDNGGSNAWVCPYGCHTVPFDRTVPA